LPDPRDLFDMSDEPENRVLVVGPAWVGDMIMAQTLFKFLRSRWPDRDIDVLAPAATVSLVARMPEISVGILLDQRHGEFGYSYRKNLGHKLRERHYRQAFILPNSMKSALVPFFADIPVRTGFRGEYRYVLLSDIRMLSEKRLPRMVDRFVALGVAEGEALPAIENPALMTDADNLATLLETHGLSTERPVLGICPGAEYGDAKRWPERHYANLAEYAVSRGMQVWIFGGEGDRAMGDVIASLTSPAAKSALCNLTGETSLTDAIDLLGACRLVVTNDSGLMHVAAAVGCSVAVLYGSTSPGFTPPLTEKAHIFSENLSCSPCFKRTCPLGHKNCLENLLPSKLYGLIDQHASGAPQ